MPTHYQPGIYGLNQQAGISFKTGIHVKIFDEHNEEVRGLTQRSVVNER
jgi:hypothetical protein